MTIQSLFRTVVKKFKALQKLQTKRPKKKEVKKVALPRKTETVQKMELEISSGTVVKVLLIILLFVAATELIVQLKGILIMTAISFLLAMGLSPILDTLEERKIPRPLAIGIIYIIFLGMLTILFVQVIPIIAEQLLGIAYDLRDLVISGKIQIPFLESLGGFNVDTAELQRLLSENLVTISRNLQSVAGSTFGIITGIFQGLFNFIFTLVLLFFILLEREDIGRFIVALFPKHDRQYVHEKALSIQAKMSEWFRGQMILMLSVGLFIYVGMKFFEYTFDMQYAATIAIFAGFMELFPYIGVMLAGILAGIIAINISWIALVAVLAWIVLTQFLEGNFLVPVVMEKVVGLSSAVVILVLAIGGILGYAAGGVAVSILGMIFAVPVAASIGIFVQDYAHRKTQ